MPVDQLPQRIVMAVLRTPQKRRVIVTGRTVAGWGRILPGKIGIWIRPADVPPNALF
jgi:hypothetical protein